MGITASFEKKSEKRSPITSLHQKVTTIHFDSLEEAKAAIRAKYDCGALIGRGASADVYEMTHKTTGKQYACKVIARGGRLNDDNTMNMESYLLQHIQHDNLINLHEMYECPGGMWLMLEYANGGDLWHGLANESNYTEATVVQYFKQVLQGVQYLHQHQILHRDLKLDNILCDYPFEDSSECILKITDFGLSTRLTLDSIPEHQALAEQKYENLRERGKENAQQYYEFAQRYQNITKEDELVYTNKNLKLCYQLWGTTVYFAPEVHQRAYGFQADIWALGCMLYEMLTGEMPFPREESEVRPSSPTIQQLLFSNPHKSATTTNHPSFELSANYQLLSPAACSLIQGMLHPNPKKRLHIDECLRHPFIVNGGLETIFDDVQRARVLPAAQHAIQYRVRLSDEYHAEIVRGLERKRRQGREHHHHEQQQQQQQQQQQREEEQPVIQEEKGDKNGNKKLSTTMTGSSYSNSSTSPSTSMVKGDGILRA